MGTVTIQTDFINVLYFSHKLLKDLLHKSRPVRLVYILRGGNNLRTVKGPEISELDLLETEGMDIFNNKERA